MRKPTCPPAWPCSGRVGPGDASVAWTAAIGATVWCDMAELPRATFDEVFADPVTIGAAAFAPSGTIEPVDGGYRITGRWGFASGIRHATVLYANAVEPGPSEVPLLRAAVLDPSDVTIEDTWHVSASAAAGAITSTSTASTSALSAPSSRWRVTRRRHTARADLDAVGRRAPGGGHRHRDRARSARRHRRHRRDEGAAPRARATRPGPAVRARPCRRSQRPPRADALLGTSPERPGTAASPESPLPSGTGPSSGRRRCGRRAGAAGVVDTAYRLAGGGVIYANGALQRRWRDVHAVTQHFIVKDGTFAACGSVLAGGDPGVPVF